MFLKSFHFELHGFHIHHWSMALGSASDLQRDRRWVYSAGVAVYIEIFGVDCNRGQFLNTGFTFWDFKIMKHTPSNRLSIFLGFTREATQHPAAPVMTSFRPELFAFWLELTCHPWVQNGPKVFLSTIFWVEQSLETLWRPLTCSKRVQKGSKPSNRAGSWPEFCHRQSGTSIS